MSAEPVILRVSATYHLSVKVGDRVRREERLREGPNEDGRFAAPVSGVVKSIEFDAGSHEFVVTIAPAP
jgi:Na+-translocating ferredoxin:NAD+ oxidoreductase RnfC subunit